MFPPCRTSDWPRLRPSFRPPARKLTLRQVIGEMRESLSNRSFLFLLAYGVTAAMAWTLPLVMRD